MRRPLLDWKNLEPGVWDAKSVAPGLFWMIVQVGLMFRVALPGSGVEPQTMESLELAKTLCAGGERGLRRGIAAVRRSS